MKSKKEYIVDLVESYVDTYEDASEEIRLGAFMRLVKEMQNTDVEQKAALEFAVLVMVAGEDLKG